MAQAVVFIEENELCFEPLTLKNKHKCLLPLATVPIVDYTFNCLKKSSISTVTLFCTSHLNDIKAHVNEVWGKQGFNVTVVDAAKYKGYIGEALYSLDKKKFTEPFLVLYGDTVSNINFQEILSEYQAQKAKRPTLQMLAALKEIPVGELNTNRTSAVIWDNIEYIQQMHFGMDARKFWRNDKQKEHTQRGLLAEAAICAPSMLNFSDDFKSCKTLQNVMWAMQRDQRKIKQPALGVQFLKEDQYIGRVTSIHKFVLTVENVLSGKATDYGQQKLEEKGYTLSGTREFRHKDADINMAALIYENASVGKGTLVSRHARIVNSTIGENCKIGSNAWIEGAVIGDGSVIEDNARVVYSLLDKKCKIGNDATVMPWSVFGEEINVPTKVTKTCYSWEWKGKKKEEPKEIDLDDSDGPHEITDWDDLDVDSDDDTELLTHGIEPEIIPESVDDICDMYYDYIMLLFEQSVLDPVIMKRCIREIVEMRRAFKVPVRKVARLVTRGVVLLPVRENGHITADQYMARESQLLRTFQHVLEYLIRTRESMSDCQDGIRDGAQARPQVIQPHHREIVDLLRTANVINDNAPGRAQPADKQEQEKRQAMTEKDKRESQPEEDEETKFMKQQLDELKRSSTNN